MTPAPVRPDPVPPSVREALNRLVVSVDRDVRGVEAPAAAASGTLVDDAIARRRGTREPIRTLVFDRTEQVRLEWPARGFIDHVDARVLDRMGHPLAAPIPAMLEASRTPPTVVAELPLATFARGDYVIELTVVSGGNDEHRFVAFRVR